MSKIIFSHILVDNQQFNAKKYHKNYPKTPHFCPFFFSKAKAETVAYSASYDIGEALDGEDIHILPAP